MSKKRKPVKKAAKKRPKPPTHPDREIGGGKLTTKELARFRVAEVMELRAKQDEEEYALLRRLVKLCPFYGTQGSETWDSGAMHRVNGKPCECSPPVPVERP